MNTFALASDSMMALALALHVACAIFGVLAAVILGTLLASRLAPFDPSYTDTAERDMHYTDAQLRLSRIRAQRRAKLASLDTCETTRPMRMTDARIRRAPNDNTMVDRPLQQTFAVSIVPVHHVSSVCAQRTIMV